MIYILISLLAIVAVFANNTEMTDTHIIPKWICTLGIVAVAGVVYGILIPYIKQYKFRLKPPIVMVALICFCQALYAIIQALKIGLSEFEHQATGSFDNPAGLVACICTGIPCCIYLIRTSECNIIRTLVKVIIVVIETALILSESRTGILAGIFPITLWLLSTIKKRWVKILLLAGIILLLPVMYFMKKDSADGRLLMFRCGWDMIKDRPIFGHGINGVQANYMDYQARWFSEHPESHFTMLADNVKSVFNEYLTICICFGSVGLIVLVTFVCFILHCYRKKHSEEGLCSLMSLGTIGILGCFSYPFSYPFTWIVFVLNTLILICKAYPINFSKCKRVRYMIATTLFLSSSFLLYHVIKRYYAEVEWGEISHMALKGEGEEVFPRYKALMPVLGNEPYFLYNFAAELYMERHYETALVIAERCQSFWADYDLELLLGELYYKQNKYDEAERYFNHAHNMCPVRFLPLYRLFQMYKKIGDKDKARQMGLRILNKPIKVKSETIDNIIESVKQDYFSQNQMYK